MPAMRAGKVLRFYWSETERWLRGGDVACRKVVARSGFEPKTSGL
jgi:hypothetical protein